MTDIFQSWKENKFIIASTDITDGERVVVLTDIKFWTDQYDELIEWCQDTPGTTISGMVVVFDNEQALTMFTLKWV